MGTMTRVAALVGAMLLAVSHAEMVRVRMMPLNLRELHLRPIHLEDMLNSLMGGGGFSGGVGIGGGGASFARAENGDVVATVHLPALARPEGAEVKGEQRAVAARLAHEGRALRVDARAQAGEGQARAVVTLTLPERVVAVRAAGLATDGSATVVLVPGPGVRAALPKVAEGVVLPTSKDEPAVASRIVSEETGAGAASSGGSGAWWFGAGVLMTAFAAIGFIAHRSQKEAETGPVVVPLSTVLSQRAAGGRGRGELFEKMQKAKGEKGDVKVS